MTTTTSSEDDRRVRYLLGELSPPEADALENQYFQQDADFEALLAREEDLIEAYCEGTLPPALRGRFESVYLDPASRRRHVELARSLGRLAHRRARLRGPSSPWTWAAALAALLIVIVGLVVSLVGAHGRSRQLAQEVDALRRELAARDARAREQATRLKQRPEARTRAGAGRLVSIALASGLLRGDEPVPRVVIPPDTTKVRFVLGTHQTAMRFRYRAALQDVEGRERWAQEGLRPERTASGPAVVIELDPGWLDPGHHVLVLSRPAADGRPVVAGEYVFQVARQP